MTIFDIIKDVLKEKTGNLIYKEDFGKVFNVYMLARYFSMRVELIPYAQWLNQYGHLMTKENAYKFLVQTVPKTNNCFIKYLKSKNKLK